MNPTGPHSIRIPPAFTALVAALTVTAFAVPAYSQANLGRSGAGRGPQATAGAGADLSIPKASVMELRGRNAKLAIFLRKAGRGRVQDNLKIIWSEGKGKDSVLWQGQATFSGGRDGFMFEKRVTLPKKTDRGEIRIIAGSPGTDHSFQNNEATISFLRKGDLGFDGRPTLTQKVGAQKNREFSIKVKNFGSRAMTGCKVQFKVTEQGPALAPRNVSLAAIAPGASVTAKVDYNFRSSRDRNHNKIEATLKCDNDLVAGNNTYKGQLTR